MPAPVPRALLLLGILLLSVLPIGCASDADDVTDAFELDGDYTVTLWAESPQFFNPTNIDVDARGRVWVAEAVNYRDFNNAGMEPPYREGGDRIVILEDTDGDGRADESNVFVQDPDLRAPLGLAVIGNRVIVSSSPNLIVFTDDDGDDRSDRKEVLLTGFGGYDHDHGLHALLAGPDGRYYFNTGNAGPHMVTDRDGWTLRSGSAYNGGTPYNKSNSPGRVSDDGRVWVGGLALRMQPDGTELRVMAHNFRNAYELTVDSYGDMWQNDNDDQVLTCRTTWLMEDGNAGYFSADGSRFWPADHRPGQDTFTAHWHQDDPGVQPAGDNYGAGSPTGVVVYEGDAFGPDFRGSLLSADAGRNVVYAYETMVEGAGFGLHRRELISSMDEDTHNYLWNDPAHDANPRAWFRPSDVAVGPDGAIYVADWYDPVVGGHQSRDARVTGRIYRITPRDEDLDVPTLDLNTTIGQVEALKSPAIHVRALGYQALVDAGEAAAEPVQALLESENPYHRARAAWVLARLGPAGERRVESLLLDNDPRLRVTAFRALRQVRDDIVGLVRLVLDDPSAAVRREAAIALRDVPWAEKEEIVIALAKKYGGVDRWYLEALGTAALGDEARLYQTLVAENDASPVAWSDRFADLVWRLHPAEAVDALAARAAAPTLTESQRNQALDALAFVGDPAAARALADLAASDDARLTRTAEAAGWWLRFRATNDWRDVPVARAALESSRAEAAPDSALLALRDRIADTLLTVDVRVQAATALAADAYGGALIVGLMEERPLPYQVRDVLRTALARNPDPAVRALAAAHFRSGEAAASLPDLSDQEGESGRGATLFRAQCSMCHRIGDLGRVVGPDLSAVGDKFDASGLLEAVVAPSASIAHGYEPWMLTLEDGGVLIGFLQADGETLVLSDIAGVRHTLPADDVAERRVLDTSLMPDARGIGLSERDLADLVAFLSEQRGREN